MRREWELSRSVCNGFGIKISNHVQECIDTARQVPAPVVQIKILSLASPTNRSFCFTLLLIFYQNVFIRISCLASSSFLHCPVFFPLGFSWSASLSIWIVPPPCWHPPAVIFAQKKGEKEWILAHRSCLADVKSWNKWRFVRAQDWRISTAPVHPAAPIYQCNIVASQQRNCTNLLMHQFTNDAYSTYMHPSSNTPMHHFALQQCTVSRVQWNECHVI